MIVVKIDEKVSFIQSELDDYTLTSGKKKKVKTYNLNKDSDAKLIHTILNPLESRKIKQHNIKKKRSDSNVAQQTISEDAVGKKKSVRSKIGQIKKKKSAIKIAEKPKIQANINQMLIKFTNNNKNIKKTTNIEKQSKQSQKQEIPSKKVSEKSLPAKPTSKPFPAKAIAKPFPAVPPINPRVKPEQIETKISTNKQNKSAKLISEDIIKQFGNSGELEIQCPFCRSEINFHYEDVDRRSYRSTRICNSCESINRVSISIGNRSIFKDFELSHPEIAGTIKKLENNVQDEFGNPIFTYAFPNTR
jgi:hypothetical protein